MKQLVIYSAAWCGPCRSLKQTIANNTIPVDEITFIDVDEHPMLARENNVRGVPSLFIYEDGKPSRHKSGAMTLEQLLQFIGD